MSNGGAKISMLESRFHGKSVLITGGGRGLGKAIALRFAAEGAGVIVNDLIGPAAEEVADAIRRRGTPALAVQGDVSVREEVERMVTAAVREFERIDILVNNAGITKPAFILDLAEADWDVSQNVNLKSMFLCCKAVLPQMISRRSGRIINMSSKSGKQGGLWLTAYSASKFGVIGFTQSLALDVAPYGITANAVCPGIVFTPQWEDLDKHYALKLAVPTDQVRQHYVSKIPLGREATPEDVAGVVAFLASDEASYMTGQALNVAGGQEMR